MYYHVCRLLIALFNLAIFNVLCVGCLILELIGIIKQNSGLIIFSCVFRILQVLGFLIGVGVLAFWLVVALHVSELDVDDVFDIATYIIGGLLGCYIIFFIWGIYRTVMQFKLKSLIKNGDGKV